MNDDQVKVAVAGWGSALENAMASGDRAGLEALFEDPSYFRDNGALTWDYRQFHGRDSVVTTLLGLAKELSPHNFRLSADWPEPHVMGEGDAAIIEGFLDFETKHGRCVLVLNALPAASEDEPTIKARAIFTRLEGLSTIHTPDPHPRGRGYTPSVPGQTWKEHRAVAQSYEGSDPDVIVVGAGQSGLVTAAYLRRFGVDVLNIDRYDRVGDSWGRRYASLALHNPVEMNGFPFLPFPPHYPEYLSKDLMSEWLDIYARYMDLNVWTATEFSHAKYDEKENRWAAVVRDRDGTERTINPRHIVMATGGIGGRPAVPDLPGLGSFAGKVMHSSQFTDGAEYGIKRAVIVGVATSAHDIARNLVENGVEVTMLQRSPVVITNVDTANLAYAGYIDPTQTTDLVDIRYGIGLINPLRELASQAFHKIAKEMDKNLLDRLEAAGLQLGDGVDNQGFLDLFLRTGGGYYLNTGTSEFIADGTIKIQPYARVTEFVPAGVKFDDGSTLEADIIVLATGYQSRKTEVVDAFGDEVADRVGEIARLDSEGEWANVWSQSGQRGLWFNGGGINQMRPGSERLALLIKADLDGLIPDVLRRGAAVVAAQPIGAESSTDGK
jgi:putative flavoprotein involved in K+ transport